MNQSKGAKETIGKKGVGGGKRAAISLPLAVCQMTQEKGMPEIPPSAPAHVLGRKQDCDTHRRIGAGGGWAGETALGPPPLARDTVSPSPTGESNAIGKCILLLSS